MLEFLQNLPSTTISTTTISTTTSASTLTFELITKISPDWSVPAIDVMENLYYDDRFEDIRKCLLQYVYGDNWTITEIDCSKTTTDMNLVMTTAFTAPASFLPATTSAIRTVNFVNAACYNGRSTIVLVLLLISIEIRFN